VCLSRVAAAMGSESSSFFPARRIKFVKIYMWKKNTEASRCVHTVQEEWN
jgi:hypothetical protein